MASLQNSFYVSMLLCTILRCGGFFFVVVFLNLQYIFCFDMQNVFYTSIKSHPLNYRIYCLWWKKLYIWVTFHCQKTLLVSELSGCPSREPIFRTNQHFFLTWAHRSCWLLWGPVNLSQVRGCVPFLCPSLHHFSFLCCDLITDSQMCRLADPL